MSGKGKGNNDVFRFAYDPVAAMRNAPVLMGMELVEHGGGLQGQYYLNGDRHGYRKDKLKVFISKGSVWVSEEGDRCISLPQWLVEYGGCEDFKEAVRRINGKPQAMEWSREVRERAVKKVQYVSEDALIGARAFPLEKCPLFVWMCGMFPEARVREVWSEYNVTTDSKGRAVFWYVDGKGRILHDKRMAYVGGHRDKSVAPGREYRVGDGYSGRCYFGSCVPGDGKRSFLCESEKSCLLGRLYWGRRFMATGGKSGLVEVGPGVLLVPDMDAREEWGRHGEVWPWWEKAGMPVERIPEHWDIGDLIEYRKSCGASGM